MLPHISGLEGSDCTIIKFTMILFYGVPRRGGSGFPFQVLATRTSWLWAFHYNPSRMRNLIINTTLITMLL